VTLRRRRRQGRAGGSCGPKAAARRRSTGSGRPLSRQSASGSGRRGKNGCARRRKRPARSCCGRPRRCGTRRAGASGTAPGVLPGPRGPRHPLPAVLALVVLAMLHGKTRLAAMTAWIAHAGQEVLELAGCRHRRRDGRLAAPSPKTVTRCLGLAGARALAGAVSRDLAAGVPAGAPGVSRVRAGPASAGGLRREDGPRRAPRRRHLPVPPVRRGRRARERPGRRRRGRRQGDPPETSEVPEISPMLGELNGYFPWPGRSSLLTHCTRKMTSPNWPGRRPPRTSPSPRRATARTCTPPSRARAARHVTTDKGHGRAGTRACLVMDAPE
jgi:hypothetical protein